MSLLSSAIKFAIARLEVRFAAETALTNSWRAVGRFLLCPSNGFAWQFG